MVLDSQPTAAVTVTVNGASGTDLTVSPASLTFATTNWDQPQTVTVSAAEDEDAVADDAVTLTHTARDGGYDGVTGDSVTVAIAEDDIVIPSNLVSVTADAPHGLYVYNGRKGSLREVPPGMYDDGPAPYVYEGEEATFTVTLSGGAATAAVEVSYEVGGEVTPGRDYTAPAGMLRIPRGSASGTIRIQTFLDVNGLTEFPERLEVTLTGATSTSGAVGVDPARASAMMLLWEGKKRWVFVAETTVTEIPDCRVDHLQRVAEQAAAGGPGGALADPRRHGQGGRGLRSQHRHGDPARGNGVARRRPSEDPQRRDRGGHRNLQGGIDRDELSGEGRGAPGRRMGLGGPHDPRLRQAPGERAGGHGEPDHGLHAVRQRRRRSGRAGADGGRGAGRAVFGAARHPRRGGIRRRDR